MPPPLTIQNAYGLVHRMFDADLAEASFRDRQIVAAMQERAPAQDLNLALTDPM